MFWSILFRVLCPFTILYINSFSMLRIVWTIISLNISLNPSCPFVSSGTSITFLFGPQWCLLFPGLFLRFTLFLCQLFDSFRITAGGVFQFYIISSNLPILLLKLSTEILICCIVFFIYDNLAWFSFNVAIWCATYSWNSLNCRWILLFSGSLVTWKKFIWQFLGVFVS